jgi:hypothetical protein
MRFTAIQKTGKMTLYFLIFGVFEIRLLGETSPLCSLGETSPLCSLGETFPLCSLGEISPCCSLG